MNHKTKPQLTLQLIIMSLFAALFTALVITLITISYLRISKNVIDISSDYMDHISASIHHQMHNQFYLASLTSKLSAQLISQRIINPNEQEKFAHYMRLLLNYVPHVQKIAWADKAGNFVSIERRPNQQTAVTLIDRQRQPMQYEILYDKNQQIVKKQQVITANFNPQSLRWFQQIQKTNRPFWSDVFRIYTNKLLAITVASPVSNKTGLWGGFAIVISLDNLSKILANKGMTKDGTAFILDQKGQVIAFPKLDQLLHHGHSELTNINKIPVPWVSKSFEVYQTKHQESFIFKSGSESYLANYFLIPEFATYHWVIAIVVPMNQIVGDLIKSHVIFVVVSLIFLTLGLLIIYSISTRLVLSIKKLVQETDNIKNFHLEDDIEIDTHIKEVNFLSDAIYSMKNGLRSFEKYVPANLVQRLIKSGESSHIGGKKKELTVLFTDIENFTAIAESNNPEQLMQHLCEYFEEMTQIILDEKGTIDKYIGDSIMVFWNAPLSQKNHIQLACRAALHCLQRLKELNAIWQKEGKPILITRMGINTGTAIVGNVGSSERLNYTAFGDNVNIASRLETINKLYGTSILVSEEIYHETKETFLFRKIDLVAVKGRVGSMYIYELLAENLEQITFNLIEYNRAFELGFKAYQQQTFNEAQNHFQECLGIYPKDTVSKVFIQRCNDLQNTSLPKDWDGVWRLKNRIL